LDRNKFRRQHNLEPYVVDFVCFDAMLIVELDGSQHADSVRDIVRDAALKQKGFRVLKSLPCDFFLGAHGSYFDMETKYVRFKAGLATAFVDPNGYKSFVTQKELAFRRELEKQRAAAK